MNSTAGRVSFNDRLRAAGRVVLFLVFAVIALAITLALEALVDRSASVAGYRPLVSEWSTPLGLLIATFISVRLIDRKGWDFVWLGRSAFRPSLIAIGAVVGAAAIGLPSLLLLSAGELSAVPAANGSWFGAAALAFLNLLPAAAGEELFLRGYIFSVLRESIGWRWTLIVTSIVFGMLHLNNPGVDAESVLLVILAGFFLGTILLATRSLYCAIAVHFAWNWVMAAALHTPVSGIAVVAPDYKVVDSGPDWLTGGTWGPEGGLAAAVSMFVVVLFIYGRYLRHTEQSNG
ncbi:MAG TPA: type II CAAX endopeptidase family protein [Gemmatimonadaceae bacterium]|nr:type II CAAX endopeptidase family protein [Gemmatimonadaceae bacterium]